MCVLRRVEQSWYELSSEGIELCFDLCIELCMCESSLRKHVVCVLISNHVWGCSVFQRKSAPACVLFLMAVSLMRVT